MGVQGLWRLIEPSGKPVPLETLENKVLAVDVSIWLHQAVKGFQDSRGAPLPNAHLLGIYHRVCKLLYFKIKPVFVFDGGVPALKRQTIAKRNQLKSKNLSEADRIQKQLLSSLLKHTALSKVLSEKIEASILLPSKINGRSRKDDIYVLPPAQLDSSISDSEDASGDESTSETPDSSPTKHYDLHTIDVDSSHFKSLPVEVRHEILTDLKETRKQSSWGRLHQLPKFSDDFATYQMKRLLKRQSVQAALDETGKEMGGHSLSLAELESLLKDQGVITNQKVGNRIASDENKRYLLVKDVKEAMRHAQNKEQKLETIKEQDETSNDKIEVKVDLEHTAKVEGKTKETNKPNDKADKEFKENLEKAIALSLQEGTTSSSTTIQSQSEIPKDEDLEKAIELSLQDQPSTSKIATKTNNKLEFSFLDNSSHKYFASDSSDEEPNEVQRSKNVLSSAENYMMEYSGLTPNEIAKIIGSDSRNSKLKNKQKAETKVELSEKDSHKENILTDQEQADIEIMSTSSDSSDLMEVTDGEAKEFKPIEIVVNPSEETNDGDDLFRDIFIADNNKCQGENIISNHQKIDIIVPGSIKIQNALDAHGTKMDINNSGTTKEIEKNEETKKGKDVNSEIVNENDVTFTHKQSLCENKPSVEQSRPSSDETSTEEQKGQHSLPNKRNEKNEVIHTQKITVQELEKMKHNIQMETNSLLNEKSSKERLAGNITDQMYQEAQELLQLFGVPYLIAPMEAEAQCAFLDEVNLTDGTITDDSDIWLFGGKTVYKNFFNQSKYVMEFKAENIQHHFKLSREQMVLLALLVGSDYTTGIQGIGPVTALEVLAAFPPSKPKEFCLTHNQLISGLAEFRSWFKKGKSPGPGRTSLRSKLKNVSFNENFPNVQVVQAYLEPKVDKNKETFSWGKPDVEGLKDLAKEKFGWTRLKTEEILKPVLQKLEEKAMQKSIKDFFKITRKIDTGLSEGKVSKRVKTAIDNIGKDPLELIEEEFKEKQKQRIIRRKKNGSVVPDSEKGSPTSSKRKKKNEEQEMTSDYFSKDSNDIEVIDSKSEVSENKANRINKKSEIARDEGDEILSQIKRIRDRRLNSKKAAVETKKPKLVKKKNKTELKQVPIDSHIDEEVSFLKKITMDSAKRVEEINNEIQNEINKINKKPPPIKIHKKEVIPQKERDKTELLRNKLKAIEVFRKGKRGPGYVSKRNKTLRLANEDAGLSESSSDG